MSDHKIENRASQADFSSPFYNSSGSTIFLLCFTGLLRLSGMVRSAGGAPIPKRARRRASVATLYLDFFFIGIFHQNKSPARCDRAGLL